MEPTVSCRGCGRTASADAALSWSWQAGADGDTLLCDGCTRAHLRSIEGKLDEAWW